MVDSSVMFTKYVSEWATNLRAISLNVGITTYVYSEYHTNCEDKGNTSSQETTLTGNCFRINPNGKLRGKGGDYGKMQLMFFADLNEYR